MYLIQNGKTIKETSASISPNNRSFRYGDGCFETMKVMKGKLLLKEAHFNRLFQTLTILGFTIPQYFTAINLENEILQLVSKNNHLKLARVRLTVYRGDGGLYDEVSHQPNYLIQTWDLNPQSNKLNENGLVIDVFEEGRKVCDGFSALKTNNFLVYTMAAIWAKRQHLNDALVLNPFNNIADATIANVFIIKDSIIKTPSLTDGAINGIMRSHLLFQLPLINMEVQQTSLSLIDLLEADELFLSNSIYGIKWVSELKHRKYSNKIVSYIHQKAIAPLFV